MAISEIIFNKNKRQDKLNFNKNYTLFYNGIFIDFLTFIKYKNKYIFV